jgi:glycine cleavage system transcriptional repressor
MMINPKTAMRLLPIGANSMNKVILSILGHDRPGIVAAVSKILFEQNCNIENVSQTTLQLEFAGIFIVSMPGDLSPQSLHQILNTQMTPLGLEVHVTSLKPSPAPASLPECESYIITTKGPDRKGLVAGISEVIAKFGGNITNLQAVFKGGDDPGDNIMIYEVDVPTQTDQQALYRELRSRAKQLKLEIDIQHRNIFEAIHRI